MHNIYKTTYPFHLLAHARSCEVLVSVDKASHCQEMELEVIVIADDFGLRMYLDN